MPLVERVHRKLGQIKHYFSPITRAQRTQKEKFWFGRHGEKQAQPIANVLFNPGPGETRMRLGGGDRGDVYAGVVHFADGSYQKVAIKTFKFPLSTARAAQYQHCINTLQAAGVQHLPGFVRMAQTPQGEWVQIMELHGSWRNGSRLDHQGSLKTMAAKKELVEELVKIANAGYMPTTDCFLKFSGEERFLIADFDALLTHHAREMQDFFRTGKTASFHNRWERLKRTIIDISAMSMQTRQELMRHARKFAPFSARKFLPTGEQVEYRPYRQRDD